MTPILSPPPMAGHSATVHKDEMVVFGGICGHMVTGRLVWFYLVTRTVITTLLLKVSNYIFSWVFLNALTKNLLIRSIYLL